MSTMKARLHRLEQRSRPDPAPVRFTIRTGEDDEDVPGTDGEGWTVRRFTIHLDRPGGDLAEEDPDA
jgi:hypothetical protein